MTPTSAPSSMLAGFLSYVVPGLGQIYQGRVGKGVLFMVCLLGMYFYGMALGDWKNVYLPDTGQGNQVRLPPIAASVYNVGANLYNRPQFLGQFWIGAGAWPAVWQYNASEKSAVLGDFERTPADEDKELSEPQRNGDKTWDLGWVCTVIAGVLNVLVIYDAAAGPAFGAVEDTRRPQKEASAA